MAMTPEEYAARELNVHGWTEEEPLYAPGSNPSEYDPNIAVVMNGGPVKPEPTPQFDSEIAAMAHEYNFTLPLELRRAELAKENARAKFWNALTSLITSLVS